MYLSATLTILFLTATVHAQNFDPFGGFNPFQFLGCGALYLARAEPRFMTGQFMPTANQRGWSCRPAGYNAPHPNLGGVFSPDWGANLAKQIMEATKNAQRYGGITSINGVTTVTQDIGGRMYTAQLPPNSSVSTQSTTNTNNQGQLVQTVVITVNGDVTVYTTVDGRTTVTDGSGHIRMDGGPFHINSAEGHN